MKDVYHGIILDAEFTDPAFVEKFNIFAKRLDKKNKWVCFGIEIPAVELEKTIANIQENLRADSPFYAHIYNGKKLTVIFKSKIFKVSLNKTTWGPLKKYGSETLKIPMKQLDFWPTTFEEEPRYFTKERGLIE